MSNHTPIKPAQAVLNHIQRSWIIDPVEGIIFSVETRQSLGGVQARSGYWVVCTVGNKIVKRSHTIWWKYYGDWPTQQLDHDDRIKTNDRISNLKLATSRSNSANRVSSLRRALPVGVYKHTLANRYEARFCSNCKPFTLGLYSTVEEARRARLLAEHLANSGFVFSSVWEYRRLLKESNLSGAIT